MKRNVMVYAITAAGLVGCVAPHTRGVVAMKLNETDAHVCVGKEEVEPGDKVLLYRNVCTNPALTAPKTLRAVTCEKKQIGAGTITENLNEHYAAATFPAGTGFKEGDVVEKSGR